MKCVNYCSSYTFIARNQDAGTGECFGRIVSIRNWGGEIYYGIKFVEGTEICSVREKDVLGKATLRVARHKLGETVGVKTLSGPQWAIETVIVNGTIEKVTPGYTDVKYTVQLENGTTTTVTEKYITEKNTPVVQSHDFRDADKEYAKALEAEEEMLLERLEDVRKKLQFLKSR